MLLSGSVMPLKGGALLLMLFQFAAGTKPVVSVGARVEQAGEQSPRPSKLTLIVSKAWEAAADMRQAANAAARANGNFFLSVWRFIDFSVLFWGTARVRVVRDESKLICIEYEYFSRFITGSSPLCHSKGPKSIIFVNKSWGKPLRTGGAALKSRGGKGKKERKGRKERPITPFHSGSVITSVVLSTRFAFSDCFFPDGQRTSTDSTLVASPSPK